MMSTRNYPAWISSFLVLCCSIEMRSGCFPGWFGKKGSSTHIPKYPFNGTQQWIPDYIVHQGGPIFLACLQPVVVGQCVSKHMQLLYWKRHNKIIHDNENGWIDVNPKRTYSDWFQGDVPEGNWYHLSSTAAPNDQGEFECAVKWGPQSDQFCIRTYGSEPPRTVVAYRGNNLTLTRTDADRLIDSDGNNKTQVEFVKWYRSGYGRAGKEPTDPRAWVMRYQSGSPSSVIFTDHWSKRNINPVETCY